MDIIMKTENSTCPEGYTEKVCSKCGASFYTKDPSVDICPGCASEMNQMASDSAKKAAEIMSGKA